MANKLQKRIVKVKGFFSQVFSFVLLRHTRFHARRLREIIKKHNVTRLHVGCGDILLKEWLNIRFEKCEEYGRLKSIKDTLYLNYNLLKPWPIPDNSIEYIAGSHFIEHLDLNEGMAFLKECYRVMKKGGVIRLSCPDMEIYARNYVAGNQEFFNHPLIREWCAFKQAVTPGEIFVAKAYDSGGSHKWFYDFASLKHILESAGFTGAVKCQRLEGRMPDLKSIEPDRRELETLYVEAFKR